MKDMDADDSVRLMCEGTASQYHLHPEMPHLFCGCGNEAAVCHPGRCCKDDDWGQCTNCHRPAPDPDPPTEAELSDGLWASTTPLPPAGGDAP
ncbi:MAG TPA: hypothetical protein VFK41_06540 [Nocardioidaceae bacterium]|nr:hypothetical protein [Nocardioidaceae bacterium]